jgi:outer membrane protein assembly factor BamB
MQKFLIIPIFLLLFVNCSFDNKTGIWKNENENKKISLSNSNLEDAFKKEKVILEEKKVLPDSAINIDRVETIKNWTQNFYNNYNNVPNTNYKNQKIKILKTSKLAKISVYSDLNLIKLNEPFYYQNTIIYNDVRGNIYIYSINNKKKIFSYNFYKKKFKKINKKLYTVIKDNIIYVADNLGYLYALDVNSSKTIWAKNFGIPFRTEIKIVNNQLLVSDQDNNIFSVNIINGEKNWTINTAEQFLKSNFINSIVYHKEDNILFLNTSGELYSINLLKGINWVLNFKPTSIDEESQLFLSLPLVINNENLIVSNNISVSNLDPKTGVKKWSKPYNLTSKPTISKNNLFFVSNNLLTCLNIKTGEVIWSKSIKIKNPENTYYKALKDIDVITNLTIANNKVLLFSLNGYLLTFKIKNGKMLSADKISKKGFGSNPSFINKNMYFFDKKYRLFQYQ